MPRTDLLALTLDDLAALSNRGTVKRAERELPDVACTIEESDDGTVRFSWADDVRCAFPAGKVISQGTCSCPATEMCRHLVRCVLAYQKQSTSESEAQPAKAWNPGDLSDDELAWYFKPAVLTRLLARFSQGILVELVRGPKPSALFHDPPCLLRFLVPGDLRYIHCDCAETAPCSHVPLAIWAFRRLDASASAGMIDTQTQPLPIPGEVLDEAEAALLEWTEAGLAGASGMWKERLTQLEQRCRGAGLIWPAEVLAELRQQFERYVSRDSLFQPSRVPEMIGEFFIRSSAIRSATGAVPQLFIRGSASDEPLEIGSARFIGLGCDARLRKRSVELAAYMQDADSGSVVAVTRDFPDAEGEEPRPFARLAETPVLKGAHLRQLGSGQALVQGGKRNADHRLIVGRAKANVNPQNFSWEKLRAPLLVENFSEIQTRIELLPPASLRPRRVADHLFVCPIAQAAEPAFDGVSQCVVARLIDAGGASAFLEHPFSSRAAEGTELLLQRLSAAPKTLWRLLHMKMQCNQLRSLCQYRLFKPRSQCEREFLRNSIQGNGVLVPVIADETLAILKGHQRFDVCIELGINDIPVEIVHGLDEEQKRDLILQLGSHQRSLTNRDRKELARNELRHRMGNISDNALGKLVGLSDKTVKGVRDELITTSEIPNLTIRQGKDGVNRPARKPRIIPVNSLREAVTASEILREHGDGFPEGRIHLSRARKKARLAHYLNLGNKNCPTPPEEFKAICCDFRDLLTKGHVQPHSVRLIYTDPLWQVEWLKNWPELAKTAKDMLAPGGLILAYPGSIGVPVAIDALLKAGLDWVSLIAIVQGGPHSIDHNNGIYRCFTPMVAFSNGPREDRKAYFKNTFIRDGNHEKQWHMYQQGVAEAEYYISVLTHPGDLVVDLCAGGFTTMIAAANVGSRRVVGSDIDERNVRIGWERFSQEVTARRGEAA